MIVKKATGKILSFMFLFALCIWNLSSLWATPVDQEKTLLQNTNVVDGTKSTYTNNFALLAETPELEEEEDDNDEDNKHFKFQSFTSFVDLTSDYIQLSLASAQTSALDQFSFGLINQLNRNILYAVFLI